MHKPDNQILQVPHRDSQVGKPEMGHWVGHWKGEDSRDADFQIEKTDTKFKVDVSCQSAPD